MLHCYTCIVLHCYTYIVLQLHVHSVTLLLLVFVLTTLLHLHSVCFDLQGVTVLDLVCVLTQCYITTYIVCVLTQCYSTTYIVFVLTYRALQLDLVCVLTQCYIVTYIVFVGVPPLLDVLHGDFLHGPPRHRVPLLLFSSNTSPGRFNK